MADAKRDATLKLKIDTTEGVASIDQAVRASEKLAAAERDVRSEAEKANDALKSRGTAAAAVMERYGETELSKSETRRQRQQERALDRRHEAAQKAVDEYRLNKHYEGIRKERAEKESFTANNESVHDDAMKRLEEYRLKSHYERVRKERAEKEKAKKDAEDYAAFSEDFEGEQFRLEQDAANKARKDAEKAWSDYMSRAEKAAKEWQRHWEKQDAVRADTFREHIRGQLHDRGLIDARSDYQKRRDAEREGPLTSMVNGMGTLGLIGGAGFMASRFMSLGATAGNAYHHRDLTSTQRQNMILDEIPGVSSLRAFAQAVDGTTERIRRANQRLGEDQQRIGEYFQGRGELQASAASSSDAAIRSHVLSGASVSSMQSFDRSSLGGRIGYQEYQQRLGAADSAAEAQREAEVARRQRTRAQTQFDQVDEEYQRAVASRQRAQQRNRNVRANDPNNGSRQEALADLAMAETTERSLFEERIRMRQRLEQAGVSAAQAEARAREATIRQAQVELDILRQREQRLASAAQRFGSMNFLERRLANQAADAIEQHGIQNVTPEQRQRASSAFPEWFGAQAERFGESTPEFAEARRRGRIDGMTGSGPSLADTRQGIDALQQRIREDTLSSQQRLAAEVSDTLGATFERIVGELVARLERVERDIVRGRQLGTANQN